MVWSHVPIAVSTTPVITPKKYSFVRMVIMVANTDK
jgi:hypothetical protein